MVNKLQRNLTFGAIALIVLLLAGGVAVVYRTGNDKANAKSVSSTQRLVPPIPPGGPNAILSPHEYRGPCYSCHPVVNNALSTDAPGGLGTANANTPTTPLPRVGASPGQAVEPIEREPLGFRPLASSQMPPTAPGAAQRAADITPVALIAPAEKPLTAPMATDATGAGLLTPAQQDAANKLFVEGHWLGMELMDLTPSLRKIYRLAPDAQGVIVDEITLESAESGILAGDVVTSVQGRLTPDLRGFLKATESVQQLKSAEVTVNRMGVEKTFTLVAKNTQVLGFAAVEGAQPIMPGALSPHRGRRQACTECHVIMATGGQLPVDEGDITPSPPAISPNATAPHRYRGPCNSCHMLKTI